MMRTLTEDLHNRSDAIDIRDLNETYQFVIEVGSNEVAPLEVRAVLSLYGSKVFTKMPEAPTLPNGALVVNSLNASHELIAEGHNFHGHATLGRTPNVLS